MRCWKALSRINIIGLRGEVPERTNGAVSKTVEPFAGLRGFESHPLRQIMFEQVFYRLASVNGNPQKSAESGP